MSRHELRPRCRDTIVTRCAVGWDRPLATFFAQVFSVNEEGEEEAHIWVGTWPGELRSASAAIAIVTEHCDIPGDLAARLEIDRLAALAARDGRLQADVKAQVLRI